MVAALYYKLLIQDLECNIALANNTEAADRPHIFSHDKTANRLRNIGHGKSASHLNLAQHGGLFNLHNSARHGVAVKHFHANTSISFTNQAAYAPNSLNAAHYIRHRNCTSEISRSNFVNSINYTGANYISNIDGVPDSGDANTYVSPCCIAKSLSVSEHADVANPIDHADDVGVGHNSSLNIGNAPYG